MAGENAGGYQTMSQRLEDEDNNLQQFRHQQPYASAVDMEGYTQPMQLWNDYPINQMNKDDSKVNLVQEPQFDPQKSTIDKISVDKGGHEEGSVHIS